MLITLTNVFSANCVRSARAQQAGGGQVKHTPDAVHEDIWRPQAAAPEALPFGFTRHTDTDKEICYQYYLK